jgi:hypothetical protein
MISEYFMWSEIRTSRNLSLSEVCRRLPSSKDFEYAGYITKSRIRYQLCGHNTSISDYTKVCTFHTHPTSACNADVPSAADICNFLKCEHKRAITVGREWIWVWNKTQKTKRLAEKLNDWELKNMAKLLSYLNSNLPYHVFREQYCRYAIQAIGLRWSRRLRKPATWCKRLEEIGIDTTLFSRSKD